MKNKGTVIGLTLYVCFMVMLVGGLFSYSRHIDQGTDQFIFCLEVRSNHITDDPQIVADCEKLLDDWQAKRDREKEERNQKFLDKIERKDLTILSE